MGSNGMYIGVMLVFISIANLLVTKFIVIPRIGNPVSQDLLWKATIVGALITLGVAANFIFDLKLFLQ